jgi:hypothetical protein
MAFQAIAAAAAVVGTGYQISAGEKARKAQKKAAGQARTDAENAARQADRQYNAANQKAPNVAALMKRNMDASKGGVGGTFLTGTGGAPVAPGMLGRTTLLGR